MSNLYESDDFNIVSVYQEATIARNEGLESWILKVQRLPLESYESITDVVIFPHELAPTSTREEFLAAAPTIVTNKLIEFDAAFVSENEKPLSGYELLQKFVE